MHDKYYEKIGRYDATYLLLVQQQNLMLIRNVSKAKPFQKASRLVRKFYNSLRHKRNELSKF